MDSEEENEGSLELASPTLPHHPMDGQWSPFHVDIAR
jgi:hypothetical protein